MISLRMQRTKVFVTNDFFLEQKVDDVGRIDVVNDSLVQSLELYFQRWVRLYNIIIVS